MKIDMVQLRQLVAETLRHTLLEARKKTDGPKKSAKDIPNRTEKAELLRRDKHVRGTGYMHSNNSDFSEPLGDANRYKRQGAANFGNFTGESKERLRAIVERIVAEELRTIPRGR